MRLIAGMNERQLEAYMLTHRHDTVKMAMFHALREAGYWQESRDGCEKQSSSSNGSTGSSKE